MTTNFGVWPLALVQAAGEWDDQAEIIRGARKNLVQAEAATASLGRRVAPAADAFLATWVEQIRAHADQAEQHAETLRSSGVSYQVVDAEQVNELRRLLPWNDRTLRPTPGLY